MKSKLKWHDARKKLPKKDGFYLILTDDFRFAYVHFCKKWKLFNAFDSCNDHAMRCIIWAKVKAPKVLPL